MSPGTVFALAILLMLTIGWLLLTGTHLSSTPVSVPTAFPRGL